MAWVLVAPLHIMSSLAKPTGSFRVRPARRVKYWLRPPHCRISALQIGSLLVGEDAAASEKAHAEGASTRSRSHGRYHVDDELRVLPVLELGGTDIERAPFDPAETHVLAADPELARRVAHRRAAIAAAAGLVKHEVAMGARSVAISRAAASVIRTRSTIERPRLEGERAPGSGAPIPGRRRMCRRSGWHFVENDRRCRKRPTLHPIQSDLASRRSPAPSGCS